jgi:hypothetical protein
VTSWLFPVAVLAVGFTMYGWTFLACGLVLLAVMFMVDRPGRPPVVAVLAGLATAFVLAWAFA